MDEDDQDGSDIELLEAGSLASGEDSFSEPSTEISDTDEANKSSAAAAEELAAFDTKLALALGTRPPTDASNNAKDDTSSDEDMDDEQMEALDKHLEQIFREQKKTTSKKAQNKDAKEAIVNFKCRVLELLDIYIKNQHQNILAMQLLLPLLDAIRVTQSPLVSTKACNLIGEYFKLCKPGSMPKLTETESTFSTLCAVHERASLDGSNAYGNACGRASLLLVKILAAHDRENLRTVETIYGETHQRFMLDSKSRVRASFFTDWLNWSVSARR